MTPLFGAPGEAMKESKIHPSRAGFPKHIHDTHGYALEGLPEFLINLVWCQVATGRKACNERECDRYGEKLLHLCGLLSHVKVVFGTIPNVYTV